MLIEQAASSVQTVTTLSNNLMQTQWSCFVSELYKCTFFNIYILDETSWIGDCMLLEYLNT